MKSRRWKAVLPLLVIALSACDSQTKKETKAAEEPGVLAGVGSISINQKDLEYHLKENHNGRDDEQTRRKALEELTLRAQHVQAALDADLDRDPAVRAEIARLLTNRHREEFLAPRLRDIASQPIAESRLRELYQENESRFRSTEKRQVAVLWLNPNGDAGRTEQYLAKLNSAREWFFNNDLKNHPEQGFATLAVDHSEHSASRHTSGIVGWLESTGGMDPWTKAVATIAFSLQQPGEVSQVITRPEGLFLVRLMAQKPAFQRPLEAVSPELEQAERQRLRQEIEADFQKALNAKHPPQRTTLRTPTE